MRSRALFVVGNSHIYYFTSEIKLRFVGNSRDLLLVASHRKISLIEKNGMVTIRHDLRLLGIAAILRLVVRLDAESRQPQQPKVMAE